MLPVLALLFAFAGEQGVRPPAPAPPPSVITSPDWLSKPTSQDLEDLYPKAAARDRVEGRAVIRCLVAATGDLTDCKAISEQPEGAGFGDAALAMAPKFKMRPMTRNGAPVAGGVINIPIRFTVPNEAPPPSAQMLQRCYGYAAAEAERNPTSKQVQIEHLAFGMMAQLSLASDNLRPSELAARLASFRHAAEPRLDDPQSKVERDQCTAAIAMAGPEMQQMINAIPR